MNRYLFLHRVRGPLMLVVFGVTALLNQWGWLTWSESWPLYLIAFGLLQLAERAAWSQAQIPPQNGWGGPFAGSPVGSVPPASTSLSVAPPAGPQDKGPRDEGRR
jgi:hypothetical protein